MAGKQINIKLILAILALLATGGLSRYAHTTYIPPVKPNLQQYMQEVEGYTMVEAVAMTPDHVQMLMLDDYAFLNFSGQGAKVNLYIGYYLSANKAYSAHSPLICYPSQGWQVETKPQRGSLQVGPHTIDFEEIVTSYGERQELVLYWYQSRLMTNTQVYKNKIDMGYNKLMHQSEEHGFIRVAVPFADTSPDEAREQALQFIRAFYPRFAEYISQSS